MRKKCYFDEVGLRWKLDSMTEGVKEPVNLKWCRLGIFNKIYKRLEIFSEVVLERDLSKKETMCVFEEVRVDDYVRLNPVCAKTGLGYNYGLGNRKRGENGAKIVWSPILITPHALERLHQRGRIQRVTPETLWNETDLNWMTFLNRYVRRYNQDDSTSKFWLVPFDKGAFVVKPEKVDCYVGSILKLRPNLRNRDQVDWDYPDGYALTAVTYISNWEMYPKQDEVVKVIREGRYDDAYDLIFA